MADSGGYQLLPVFCEGIQKRIGGRIVGLADASQGGEGREKNKKVQFGFSEGAVYDGEKIVRLTITASIEVQLPGDYRLTFDLIAANGNALMNGHANWWTGSAVAPDPPA